MTIDEAIKINGRIKEVHRGLALTDDVKAIQLGVEALEAYYALRQCSAIDVEDVGRLPSETES